MSSSYGRTVRLHFNALLILVQIIISFMFFLCRALIPFLMFQDQHFVLGLDFPSWVKVDGRLVWFSERSNMDQQVVTVDQFTTAIASILEALASLRYEIDNQ